MKVLDKFSDYLSNEMSNKDQNEEVPEYYIENELKVYLNREYNINPEIPLKYD